MNNDLIDEISASPISANLITTEKRNIVVIDIPPADSYLLYALKCKEHAENSQKWAEAEESPDGQTDADSPTGDTMSAKEWALYAKQITENIGNPIAAITEEAGKIIIKKANGDSNSFYVGAVNQSTKKLLDTNYDFATQEEVQTGSDTKKPVNSAGVKQAIEYNQNKDTAVLYINGGTAEEPATVTKNTRYIEENPFKGHHIYCLAQVLYNNQWCETGWIYSSASSGSYGIKATHLLPDDNIIIQTGTIEAVSKAVSGGTGFNNSDNISFPIPCRVIVYKFGKIGEA